jgi:hypothetical protein
MVRMMLTCDDEAALPLRLVATRLAKPRGAVAREAIREDAQGVGFPGSAGGRAGR